MFSMFMLVFFCGININPLGNRGLEIEFTEDNLSPENLFFDGATCVAQPGEPETPTIDLIIGVPQDGNIDVRIIDAREEVYRGVNVKPVVPLAILEGNIQDTNDLSLEIYKQDRYFPSEIIKFSPPGYYRDINVVNIRLNPARYNPARKELVVAKRIKLRVNFEGAPVTRMITNENFENIYKHTILNYEQCKYWRRETRRQPINNPFTTGTWFKIEVGEEGIYKIGYDEIRNAGIEPKQFDPKTMKIYTAAFELLPKNVIQQFADSLLEIPVFVEGEDDHSFDKGDYLLFYGFPASHFYIRDTAVYWFENGYARKNVYWFTFGSSYGKRMERVNATWNSTEPETTVTNILHLEQDLSNPTRSGINWYWQDMSLGKLESTAVWLAIKNPKANGQTKLVISVFDSMSPTGQPFWVRFGLDGQLFFNDTMVLPQTMSLPAVKLTGYGTLNGDSSTFEFRLRRPAGTTAELVAYLNCLDLEYQRLTDMTEPFHAYFTGPRDYSIRCYRVNSKPFILDISDIRFPRLFDGFSVEDKRAVFSNHCDSIQLLYLAQLNSAISARLIPANPGKLRVADNGCEYLFITHRNFYNSIMPLVNYRRKDYTTRVVVVDPIFDDFSYGKYDPLAIKHFLYHTYNHWVTVPKFVFLIGDATYDYKNNLGKDNPPNFIPMYEAGTTLSGNPGIPPNYIYEGEYVNFFGTEAMVLGRITVRNNSEVRDFLDKLFAYEQSDIDGIWNKRIILTADDEYATHWEGTEHASACEAVSYIVTDSLYDRAKIYELSYLPFPPHETGTTKPLATADFIKELNKGALIGCFFGHGNTHQLAHEKLFYFTDIPLINNGRRPFFFYFASCTVGRFDDSDYECLAEEFVRMKYGAIGTMGAHAGSNTSVNEPLGRTLFQLFTSQDTSLTMGEVYHIAKHAHGGIPIYLMLGEPATKIRKVKQIFDLHATVDSIRPLEKLKIVSAKKPYYLTAYVKDTTHIRWIDANTANRISGHIRRTVRYNSGAGDTVVFDYAVEGKEIYQGFWSGDTAQIVTPQIPTNNEPVIKLSGYKEQLSGYSKPVAIYGNAVPSTDQSGPEVVLYDGARKLNDGDWVDSKFMLTGVVTDESGVNLLNSKEDARGFFLYLGEDNVSNRVDLRNNFIYEKNSYSKGEFRTEINLENPQDSITIYVSDNVYNQTIKKILLRTDLNARLSIENLLVYPNPVRDNNGLWVTFTLSQSARVTIKIYTVAGRLVKVIPDIHCNPGYNQRFWDGLDEFGNTLSNGVYLVHVSATGIAGPDKKIEKLIIAR